MAENAEMEIECPGTKTNSSVLIPTAWQCRYGVSNLTNVGECTVFIVPLDKRGQPKEKGRFNRALPPGDSIPHYYPPHGTEKVVVVCHDSCEGTGWIEYLAPNA